MRGVSIALLAALVLGCSDRSRPPAVVATNTDSVTPVRVMLLKALRDTTISGWPGGDIHVLFPPRLTEARARVTLQHVIDSVVAADTVVLWVRATGFTAGAVKPGALEFPVEPAMMAVWAPPDTTVPGSKSRKALHRTQFTVLKPFAADTAGKQ